MSAADRRTHYATDLDYGAALAARIEIVPVVCGAQIRLCALVTPPGPLCPHCIAAPEPGVRPS